MERQESIKLKALSDIASIDISLEFENVLREILKITCKTMNAHSGTLMLVDEITDELKIVSSFGLPANYIEKVYRAANEAGLSISSSPSGTVLKTPLKNGLDVIGLLNVYMEEVHDFNEEEINFVNIAASQASSVVQNARMCITLKNNIQELNDHKEKLEEKVNDYHKKLEKSYGELIEADRIKTEFISNITHELLTPLTSIRGFAELLDDETMGKINPEQKKSLGIILRNSNRLIKLIKELLDTLNLDNNKLGLQFGLVSINSILSKSIQDIYPRANDKQIMIIEDIQPLPEIWGDEDRLVQVIMNLLINAIKFTPQKGKITIRAIEQIEQVKISISDTGIGIPAEKLMIVFERFYQVDGSTNRKYGGIGLGLSICKSIIDKHYGSIWAQSNGQGSTFHIILPKLRNSGRK